MRRLILFCFLCANCFAGSEVLTLRTNSQNQLTILNTNAFSKTNLSDRLGIPTNIIVKIFASSPLNVANYDTPTPTIGMSEVSVSSSGYMTPELYALLQSLTNKLDTTNADLRYMLLGGELDPIFTNSPAFILTLTMITNWNNAFSWGNHATNGYLTNEPLFIASAAYSMSVTDLTHFIYAYNHSTNYDNPHNTTINQVAPPGTNGQVLVVVGTNWVAGSIVTGTNLTEAVADPLTLVTNSGVATIGLREPGVNNNGYASSNMYQSITIGAGSIPKGTGTNLVASLLTDNGSSVAVSGDIITLGSIQLPGGTYLGKSDPLGRVDIPNCGGLSLAGSGSFWNGYHFDPPAYIWSDTGYTWPRGVVYWDYTTTNNPNDMSFNILVGNTVRTANTRFGTIGPGFTSLYANGADRLIVNSNGFVSIGSQTFIAGLYALADTNRQFTVGAGWADASSDGSGYGLFAANAYLNPYDAQFRYANTHGSIGAIGFAVNYPAWNEASIVSSMTSTSLANGTFAPTALLRIGQTAISSPVPFQAGGYKAPSGSVGPTNATLGVEAGLVTDPSALIAQLTSYSNQLYAVTNNFVAQAATNGIFSNLIYQAAQAQIAQSLTNGIFSNLLASAATQIAARALATNAALFGTATIDGHRVLTNLAAIADVSGLQTALDGKASTSALAAKQDSLGTGSGGQVLLSGPTWGTLDWSNVGGRPNGTNGHVMIYTGTAGSYGDGGAMPSGVTDAGYTFYSIDPSTLGFTQIYDSHGLPCKDGLGRPIYGETDGSFGWNTLHIAIQNGSVTSFTH